ncbi:DUF5020 family protein [Bacteroides sp.]|uniref:nucleoside-specific channel-forming Tsx family protein n=1 Tax=Bacteroides sp. TaxID=29523 RepID=UPI001B73E87E|nr:DUF5020 family protein [Bacteroides sp.]MBP6064872.1 DUF5020 family protein [Bacteroides sp.]MBP6067725.1 DUF5020 family protein [Bacteroides sp.]MBP6935665.1 DUF5020 family protein [Bacteroides sp.]MBP9506920.1 DUF5020 family protein [Bacteroides sp.]MBP9585826.1 DUF5020 family protein [Bacteroides sp.]
MRRITPLFLLLLIATVALQAQNIQLHYDFGRSLYDKEMTVRPHFTTTVEKFQPDNWGSTFFFVDMDYNSNGIEQAYWEISRELKFWNAPFSIHLEYNGGLAKQYSINNAYLAGLTYSYNNANFSRGFSLSAMYKYIQKNDSPNNFQLTGTWYMNMCNNLYTFSGFADYWREKTWFGSTMTFMTEPQFWVNLNRVKGVNEKFNLSVGTELEITNNFYQGRAFVTPTLALKWTLN